MWWRLALLDGESPARRGLTRRERGGSFEVLRPPLSSQGEGDGNPLQYSCLENPMDGGAWWAAVQGVAKSPTRLSDFTFTFHFPLSCIGEGNGNPLQCSCLENPRDGEAWWAAVYGVTQSRTRLKRLSSNSCPCGVGEHSQEIGALRRARLGLS